ncbi:(4Fe-4S)-binding protein [Mucilaginibacter sp. PPCGB 2223]|uniref:(4Fe-4S)-binding protein n=1 Tax=Mucilaginibacter sp. PPCGB 2223 TaxID=1886027 RepID=UPI000825EBC8|nr:(4Fe-4S)-binding protein [Mucilaginibacter sp. PPCGB 2223]OCX53256.1 (4Fe-4S)-binding protein [Mucilaginibacter sp. PPCGB 2223]
MSLLDKKYSNDDITVFWQPEKCIHSGNCARGLHKVFDPRRKPWVIMENGTTEDIVRTVQNCPSGALSFEYKKQ